MFIQRPKSRTLPTKIRTEKTSEVQVKMWSGVGRAGLCPGRLREIRIELVAVKDKNCDDRDKAVLHM
jgi:hypothetical protein